MRPEAGVSAASLARSARTREQTVRRSGHPRRRLLTRSVVRGAAFSPSHPTKDRGKKGRGANDVCSKNGRGFTHNRTRGREAARIWRGVKIPDIYKQTSFDHRPLRQAQAHARPAAVTRIGRGRKERARRRRRFHEHLHTTTSM